MRVLSWCEDCYKVYSKKLAAPISEAVEDLHLKAECSRLLRLSFELDKLIDLVTRQRYPLSDSGILSERIVNDALAVKRESQKILSYTSTKGKDHHAHAHYPPGGYQFGTSATFNASQGNARDDSLISGSNSSFQNVLNSITPSSTSSSITTLSSMLSLAKPNANSSNASVSSGGSSGGGNTPNGGARPTGENVSKSGAAASSVSGPNSSSAPSSSGQPSSSAPSTTQNLRALCYYLFKYWRKKIGVADVANSEVVAPNSSSPANVGVPAAEPVLVGNDRAGLDN
jgi:hypothetical protein